MFSCNKNIVIKIFVRDSLVILNTDVKVKYNHLSRAGNWSIMATSGQQSVTERRLRPIYGALLL